MRILAISELTRFADGLKAVVQEAGHDVSHVASVDDAARVCSPAAARAVMVHAHVAGAGLVEQVSKLGSQGYRNIFAVLDSEAGEWEERVLIAGASFVFHLPWRAALVLTRLQALPATPRGSTPPFLETPPPRGGSRPPFLPGDPPGGTNPLLARLHSAAHVFRHASTPETFAEAFLDQIRQALALNRVALYLAQEGAGRALECAYAAGIEPKRWKMVSFSLDAGIGRWMSENLVAVSAGTPERYGLGQELLEEMVSLGAQSAIPVQGGDEFLGILLVGSRVTGYPLTNEEIELIYLLGLELGRTLKAGRLNKALASERQFLSDLTEGLGAGCLVLDRDFKVLHVNSQMAQICGGRPVQEFSFRSLPKPLASLAFEVSNGARSDAETVFADATGGTHLAKVSVFNAESRAILILVGDVTRLTAEHTGALLNLERELVARLGSQFVHEVRNSLTQLMTMGQMLPENRKDPSFLDRLEKILPKDLNRVLRHATNLEILSKPTPASRKPVPVQWTLACAWRQVCADNPSFVPAWLDVERVSEEDHLFVNAEVFSQVCYELLLNAAQAVEEVNKKRIEIRIVEVAGSKAQLVFEDSGKGFDRDIEATAVSPFVTTRNQGLGLGLTLVDKFVRESGGTLTLEKGRKLGGASVTLTLSLRE